MVRARSDKAGQPGTGPFARSDPELESLVDRKPEGASLGRLAAASACTALLVQDRRAGLEEHRRRNLVVDPVDHIGLVEAVVDLVEGILADSVVGNRLVDPVVGNRLAADPAKDLVSICITKAV